MDAWMWLTLALALAAGEAAALGSLVCIFFAFGAAVTAATRAAGWVPQLWQQSALCLAAATIALLGLRRRLRARTTAAPEASDLVGAEAEVDCALAPGGRGPAMLNGVPWQAVNIGPRALAAGERVVVRAVHGLTLEVAELSRRDGR